MGRLFGVGRQAHCSERSYARYQELVQRRKLFKEQASLFELCAAIGLWLDETKEIEKRTQLVQAYSIDKDDALGLIMAIKYPDLSPADRLKKLEEYAEAGMEHLFKFVEDTGPKDPTDFDAMRFFQLDQQLEK